MSMEAHHADKDTISNGHQLSEPSSNFDDEDLGLWPLVQITLPLQ